MNLGQCCLPLVSQQTLNLLQQTLNLLPQTPHLWQQILPLLRNLYICVKTLFPPAAAAATMSGERIVLMVEHEYPSLMLAVQCFAFLLLHDITAAAATPAVLHCSLQMLPCPVSLCVHVYPLLLLSSSLSSLLSSSLLLEFLFLLFLFSFSFLLWSLFLFLCVPRMGTPTKPRRSAGANSSPPG